MLSVLSIWQRGKSLLLAFLTELDFCDLYAAFKLKIIVLN